MASDGEDQRCGGSAEHAYTRVVKQARELLASNDHASAQALLARLKCDIEEGEGRESTLLVEPLYLLAQAIHGQHPLHAPDPAELAALERAIHIATIHDGTESPWVVRCREPLAAALHAAGDTAAAAVHMREIVEARKKRGSSLALAHALTGLADLLLNVGGPAALQESLRAYERAAALAAPEDEVMTFTILFGRGRCFVGLERYEEGLADLQHAYDWVVRRFGHGRRARELDEIIAAARRKASPSSSSTE